MVINGMELKPDQFYSTEEAAIALGLKETTLAAYRCRRGTLPFVKLGRRVRYRGADLMTHIQNCVQEPGADPARSEQAKERVAKMRRAA